MPWPLAACVWVGYPHEEKPLLNVEGVPAVFGGSLPAEIWHAFMSDATAGRPVQEFAPFRPIGAPPSDLPPGADLRRQATTATTTATAAPTTTATVAPTTEPLAPTTTVDARSTCTLLAPCG